MSRSCCASDKLYMGLFVGGWHNEVPSPGVAARIGFAVQVKVAWLVSERQSVHSSHTLSFGSDPGDAVTGTQGTGV